MKLVSFLLFLPLLAPIALGENPSRLLGTVLIPGPTSHWIREKQRLIDFQIEAGAVLGELESISDGKWARFLESSRELSLQEKVEAVHRAVNNSISYKSDFELHAVEEFWQTPLETIRLGAGDCEDHAILKMWLLVKLRADPRDLYISLIGPYTKRIDHAVLVMVKGDGFLVLDNRSMAVYSGDATPGRVPAITFNAYKIWLNGI